MYTIKHDKLSEQYFEIKHPSGLTLMLYPMQGFSTTYALFATKYGSIDSTFKSSEDADYITVPDGIAHYLEHKLFDDEDGDAFNKFAKTGANCNAYTSFDRTAYLFSCSDNFEESLSILLKFVTNPYFTEESVEKERGIIGQEIQMYDDDPDWQVYFNLIKALYQKHPLRIDIAGTVESIADIDAGLLYRCYNTFYNLNNMVLSIAGNFKVDTVVRLCDEILKPGKDITIDREVVNEPREVTCNRMEVHLPVAVSLFQIGFKQPAGSEAENFKGQILDEVLMEIVAGEASPLYRKLYDDGLINATFSPEVMAGRDYASCIFSGESRDPDAVYKAICTEIERLQKDGIDDELFRQAHKATYGRYIGMYSRVEAVASLMLMSKFSDAGVYDAMDVLSSVDKAALEKRLRETLSVEHSAISIVSPPATA